MQRRQFLIGSLATGRLLDAQAKPRRPALIPYPRQIEWTDRVCHCSRFQIEAPAAAAFAAAELERALISSAARRGSGGAVFAFRAGAEPPEGYTLRIGAGQVNVTASTPAGFLYAVSTLRQLFIHGRTASTLAGCDIQDRPAFAWRGFMHDVGRNYQDIALLKRFVDVMVRYKMNIFHFHLADDPGYRIECRVHPKLNAPASYEATRHPGKFYTYAELNDFIQYCRDRGIMVVPEIDMPGHSDYFKRAFGVEMQDGKGMAILEEVINEFLDHVDTPHLHVGSDEVEVRNPRFMDRMAGLIRRRGRHVIAWRPGNPPSDRFISQIWSYGPALDVLPGIPIVDSRNNYINHVDPFMAPVRLLNLGTCGRGEGSDMALGGILCHWPDINVGDVRNIYRQNPVFPSLLAASENYWRGNMPQNPQYWTRLPDIDTPEYRRYAEFETRLLEHRDLHFNDWPFPYVRQTGLPWKLVGPFDHGGDLAAEFAPEEEIRESYNIAGKTYRWIDANGASIAINHVQYDGWLPKFRRGTVYGLTYVWSPKAATVGFWIGFNGPSRSNRRGEPNPDVGQWSTTLAKVWINDRPLAPPRWKQPGRVPSETETPFVDEDYFYRAPAAVALKAGWNKILIKAPKAEKSWTWVFTCVPVQVEGDRVREAPGLRFSTSPAVLFNVQGKRRE